MIPKVSIILPYFNTPRDRLNRCIKSVISQTYKNIEIIVVDDGSNKDEADYIDSYKKIDDRIRIIHKKNEGSAIARNIGLEIAVGEYAMFVDSDDYLFPRAVEEAVKLAIKDNADIVIGLVKKYSSDAIELVADCGEEQQCDSIIVRSNDEFNILMDHILGYPDKKFEFEDGYVADGPVAKLFKTSLGQSSPFTGEPFFSDDTIWNINLLRKCSIAIVYGQIWYGYIVFQGSKTRGYRPNCPHEYIYRCKQQKELCDEKWPECKKGMAKTIWGNTGILCRTFLFHPRNKMTEIKKISVYLNCTRTNEYRWAMKNVDFGDEKNKLKRFVKEMDKCFVLLGFQVGSYYIWKGFTRRLRLREQGK